MFDFISNMSENKLVKGEIREELHGKTGARK